MPVGPGGAPGHPGRGAAGRRGREGAYHVVAGVLPASGLMIDFDRLARYYDLEHADYVDDLPMYAGFA